MDKLENWTDEELMQVYDLQKRIAEKIIDYVRHAEENNVYKFLTLIPELNAEYSWASYEQEVFRRNEFDNKFGEEIPQGRYIYKDMADSWKGADTLREIFEKKYQYDFAVARPAMLAVFADNMEVAFETYSIERYDKLRREMPPSLMRKMKNVLMEYPEEIEEKAVREPILGNTSVIGNEVLWRHSKENMLEFLKIDELTNQKSAETIVGTYDLQIGLRIYHPDLKKEEMTSAINLFVENEQIFRIVYGDKAADLVKSADEESIKLARRYDFVSTEERVPVLENHKICLFGTEEQKVNILYDRDNFEVTDKDYEVIMDTLAARMESEGFAKKYHPNRTGSKEYYNQTYEVIGRVKSETECQPQWQIIFEDGKIITAKADEIISSAINERLYGEQFENFGTRPLSAISFETDNKPLSLNEGKEKISAIVKQLKANGESVKKLKDFLEDERKNLIDTKFR